MWLDQFRRFWGQRLDSLATELARGNASGASSPRRPTDRRRTRSMIDIVHEIDAVQRAVTSGRIAAGEGRTVRLERTFDAPIEDVWDALTDAERISRWFLPISGELHVGGRYQLEGNAGGEVLACEPPHRFRVTWVYGEVTSPEQISELEVRLTAAGDRVDDARARAHRDRARRDVGTVRAGRRRCRLGWRHARAVAPPARRIRGRSSGVADVGGGSRVQRAEQRRLGSRERGCRRGSGGQRRARSRTPPRSTHRTPTPRREVASAWTATRLRGDTRTRAT